MIFILLILPVISLAVGLLLLFIYFYSYTKMESWIDAFVDNRVKKAGQEIENTISLYIEMEGLQPSWQFQRYCLTSTAFRFYNSWKYEKPCNLFALTAEENYIDFDQMAVFYYEEYARSYYRKALYDRLTTDLAGQNINANRKEIYKFFPKFQPFFTTESYQIDTAVGGVTDSVLNQLCAEGKFKKVGQLYLPASVDPQFDVDGGEMMLDEKGNEV